MTRNEAVQALTLGRTLLEQAKAAAHQAISYRKDPPVRRVARLFTLAADAIEVGIDAGLETGLIGFALDREAARALVPEYYHPVLLAEIQASLREIRWNAFRWSHEVIPGAGVYWTNPRYHVSAAEAKRRLARAGVTRRRGRFYLDGREIRLPGYPVPTPIGSGAFGRLGVMDADEDVAAHRIVTRPVWFVELSHTEVRRGGPW